MCVNPEDGAYLTTITLTNLSTYRRDRLNNYLGMRGYGAVTNKSTYAEENWLDENLV
jgi:hypothetical protein